MALTTQLDEAEDALLALIAVSVATPGNPLAGVVLSLGDPGPATKPEHVWIAENAATDQRWDLTGAGNQQREESMKIRVGIFVYKAGDAYQALRDRGHAMLEELEAIVRADPSIGGTTWGDAEIEHIERSGGFVTDGRALEFMVTIRATAYLRDDPA